jgi:hypothetical protein
MKNSNSLKEAYIVLAEVYRREMSDRKATEKAVGAWGKLKKSKQDVSASKPGSEEQGRALTRQGRAASVYHGRLHQNSDETK